MKKKILFISLSFPPKSDPECLQTAKYFHYLQKYEDLQIDVITSAIPTLYMPYDPDLEPYAAGVHQLISIPLRENRYVNYIRNRLGLEETVFPDVKESFHKQYNRAIKQLKVKPDLIYSRAYPNSSTIMAYKLKQVLNVPWILHMQFHFLQAEQQAVNNRISHQETIFRPLPRQQIHRLFSRCEMVIRDSADDLAVNFLGEWRELIVGPQAGFHVGYLDVVVKCYEGSRHSGCGIALHHDQVILPFRKAGLQPVTQLCR